METKLKKTGTFWQRLLSNLVKGKQFRQKTEAIC
jgi:hypothetical protein